MNCTYLPGLEEASWGECSLVIKPFARSKSSLFAEIYCAHDKAMESYHLFPFSRTYAPLMELLGKEKSMSSVADSHAKTFPQVEQQLAKKDLTESEADCGLKWRESFAKLDRDSSSWKTHQCSLYEDWIECSSIWPKWGMMHDGECWELQTLDFVIIEKEYGYLPTPTASDGFLGFANLRANRVKKQKKSDKKNAIQEKIIYVLSESNIPMSFWQEIIEEQMGFPNNWTDASNPLETHKFLQWRQSHLKC